MSRNFLYLRWNSHQSHYPESRWQTCFYCLDMLGNTFLWDTTVFQETVNLWLKLNFLLSKQGTIVALCVQHPKKCRIAWPKAPASDTIPRIPPHPFPQEKLQNTIARHRGCFLLMEKVTFTRYIPSFPLYLVKILVDIPFNSSCFPPVLY